MSESSCGGDLGFYTPNQSYMTRQYKYFVICTKYRKFKNYSDAEKSFRSDISSISKNIDSSKKILMIQNKENYAHTMCVYMRCYVASLEFMYRAQIQK